jgi:hypothetical protein
MEKLLLHGPVFTRRLLGGRDSVHVPKKRFAPPDLCSSAQVATGGPKPLTFRVAAELPANSRNSFLLATCMPRSNAAAPTARMFDWPLATSCCLPSIPNVDHFLAVPINTHR